ncbi:hypothetical protein LINGRAHAP2_LOCUS31246 [Linum grandiflorum]
MAQSKRARGRSKWKEELKAGKKGACSTKSLEAAIQLGRGWPYLYNSKEGHALKLNRWLSAHICFNEVNEDLVGEYALIKKKDGCKDAGILPGKKRRDARLTLTYGDGGQETQLPGWLNIKSHNSQRHFRELKREQTAIKDITERINHNQRNQKVLPVSSKMASSSSLRLQHSNHLEEICLSLTPSSGPAAQDPGRVLVGKFLTDRRVNLGMVKGGCRRAWARLPTPNTDEIGPNLFLFTFPSFQVAEQVWEKRPWLISDVTMVLKRWSGRGMPREISFATADLWVQVHNLDWICRNSDTMRNLSRAFLSLQNLDQSGLHGGRWVDYLRMLVEVPITRPLRAGITTPIEEGGVWIRFKYEKISAYCIFCGLVGHEWERCPERKADLEAGGDGQPSGYFKLSILAGFNSPDPSPPRSPIRPSVSSSTSWSSGSSQAPPGFEQMLPVNANRGGRPNIGSSRGTPTTPTSALYISRGIHTTPTAEPSLSRGKNRPLTAISPELRTPATIDFFSEGTSDRASNAYLSPRDFSSLSPRDLSIEMECLMVNPNQEVGVTEEGSSGPAGPAIGPFGTPNPMEGPILDLHLTSSPAYKKRRALSPNKSFSFPDINSPPSYARRSNRQVLSSRTKGKNKKKLAEAKTVPEEAEKAEGDPEQGQRVTAASPKPPRQR